MSAAHRRVVIGLALALGLASSVAEADVDWAKGLVTADGVGLADRQAPNPAVARGPARRKAEESARQALRGELGRLPLAGGGTLGERLGDAAVSARIDRALAAALTVHAEPETDGSWRLTMAVPVEAVRQAIAGPRALPPVPGDRDPAVVVVEGDTPAPAIGYRPGGVAGATLWVRAVPAWAKAAPRVKAKGTKGDQLEISPRKGGASTLFVVLVR